MDNKIVEMFAANSINSETLLALSNALCFKGHWLSSFDPSLTTEGTFHVSAHEQIQTKFMYKVLKADWCVAPLLSSSVIKLPHKSNQTAMYLIHTQLDINEFDACLRNNPYTFDTILGTVESRLAEVQINIRLPKFNMSCSYDLTHIFNLLGVNNVNTRRANLKKISKSGDLYLTNGIHTSYIEVNETGAETGAATTYSSTEKSLPMPPQEVSFDRPFIYFIRDVTTGTTLFVGRCMRPSAY